ncbi:MAG: RNA-binding protein [Candidatus Cloacimonetes bacterium]|nr:RNA-binding protein [Candidatus Cloacimonadota bacterium]
MNIYVGNLNYKVTQEDLQELFSEYGEVVSVNIINDRETGRSKGFGFVEMADDTEAENAINNLNGTSFGDRDLKVNQAKPRENRDSRPPRNRNRY